MSMKKNTFRRAFGITMLSAVLLLFTACPREIGLGSAVDTQKPVISISTPEADSVIRGNITLSGSVSDDLAVKSVTVTFASTSQVSQASRSFEATVNATDNTWALTLDTTAGATALTDSNYEIIVTATDTTNKTSTATRSFQIDNTAPTVLITSPSLYGSADNRTCFCSQLEIKGEAYDASRIQSVSVYLCNASGNVVAGPLVADGTNTWSAMFGPDDLTALEDDQVYYYYAIATDASGNTNSTFYHKADIYSLPNGTNPFPSMNDIGHLDQGTAPSSGCKLTAANLLSVRIGTGADIISDAAAQDAAYPDFTYKSQADVAILWTNLGETLQQSAIGVNTAIFATIQPPSDNSAILLDTIQVQVRTKSESTTGDWIPQTSVTKQKVGESVNISVIPKQNGQPLEEGSYEIHLKFLTNSNSEIPCNKDFLIQSDAPVVEETVIGTVSDSFAQGVISGNSAHKELKGIISRSNGSIISSSDFNADSLIITCKNSSDVPVGPRDGSNNYIGYQVGNGISYSDIDGSWILPLNLGSGADEFADDTYTFTILGSLGEASKMITRVVTVDTTKPAVNVASPADDSCITISQSGTGLTIQGTAMDTGSGIATTYWCLDEADQTHLATDTGVSTAAVLGNGDTPVNGRWYRFGTPTVFNLTPDMTGKAQTAYKVFIFTKDAAGYTSAENDGTVTEVPFFIDNEKPHLSVNAWPSLIRKNVEGMTISGKAWDSSGSLDKVYVSFDGNDAVVVQDLSSGAYTEADKADWTFPGSAVIDAALWTDGTHTLAFSVKDSAGRTSDVVTNTFTIDNVAPVVSVATLADGAVLSDMTPISGTAIDALSGLKKITYSVDNGSTWNETANNSGSWSITLPDNSGEDEQTICIKAEDNAGNAATSGNISFTIDKAHPRAVLKINGNTVNNGETFMTKEGFTFSGTADDAAQTTGRKAENAELTYSKDGGSSVLVFDKNTNASCWNKDAGTWSWTSGASFAEGFYTFTLKVTDKAGKTTTVTQSVRYDKTAPVLVVSSPAENEPFNTATVSLNGSVSDSGSGVDRIYYTLDGGNPTLESDYITPTGNSWSKTVTFNEQGVHTLRIMAVDKLGNGAGNNESDIKTIHFSRDDAKPELRVLSVDASGKTTKDSFRLGGTAWDTNGLESVSVTDGSTTWTGTGVAGEDLSLTKKTADPMPGNDESKWNWYIDFAVGSSNASSSTYVADGTKTFTITATDVAGKTVSATRTVTVDTTDPVISEAFVESALVKLDESFYDKLTVSASDGGTGLAGVYYQVFGSEQTGLTFSDGSWTSLALGAAGWSGNVDFSTDENKVEGNHYIYIAAKDNAGNTTIRSTPVFVSVDKQKPVITVNGATDAADAGVTLTITIADTNPDADELTAEVRKPDGSSLGMLAKTAGSTANTWTVAVPFNTAAYIADGLYQIIVNETDTRGRAAVQVIHTIRKDTTAPAVNTIDSPETDKTGSNALYGSSYLFRGTAKDKEDGTDCAGLGKIRYAFSQSASAPAASECEELAASDGTWTITRSLNEGKTATAAGNLHEGRWYLYVYAEDKAGNCTDTAAVRVFDIDMKDPVLSFASTMDITQTAYTAESSYSMSGTATDTNGIDTLTVQVGTETAVPVTVAADGSWTMSISRTAARKDKLLSAKFILKDVAGKTTEKSVPFYFDTLPPEITITKPAENEPVSTGTYTLTGTVADIGAGVDAAEATFIIKKGSETVKSGSLSVTGASWSTDGAVSLGTTEGLLDLTVTIKDALGQAAEKETSFYYDKNDPELRVLSVSSSGMTTKDNFQLAGTAWDTNELDCITVSDGTHTWTISEGVSPTMSLTKKTADPGNAVVDRNWHIDFGVGSTDGIHIGDGTTTFTITAKDVAGKTVSATRTVTVDTTAPSVSSVSTEGTAGIPADKVFLDVSKYKKLTVTASDPEVSEGMSGTGLAGVFYQVVAASAAAPAFDSDSGWTALALSSGSTWTANLDFTGKTEGNWKVYVAARDNAGNRTRHSEPVTLTVDAQKPAVTVSGVTNAKATGVVLSIFVDDTNPTLPSVSVTKPGSATPVTLTPVASNTAHTWQVTVPFNTYTADGIYQIVVNETDATGRAAEQVTHTIRKDTTPPAVNSIDAPAVDMTGTSALYGTSYLFRGTAEDIHGSTDCAGLAKVLYAFSRADSAPAIGAYTEIAMADGTWSVTKSLEEGPDPTTQGNLCEGKWYLYVIAEDKAGNRSEPAVRAFDVDMNNPVLSFPATLDTTQTTYSKAGSFTISGTASDTNGIQGLSVQIDDGTPAAVSVGTNGAWTYTVYRSETNRDKPLSARFVLTDVVGKITEKTVPFYFDTQAPSVTISLPEASQITTVNTCTLSGTVADVGAGVDAAQATYVITKGSTSVASGNLTVTGASWKAENVSLGDEGSEGTLTLTVTFKDKVGLSATQTRTFYKDLNPPVINELSVTSNGLTTNANFKLAGTAWDTNELDCIIVSDGTTTWSSADTDAKVSLTKRTSAPAAGEANWNWNMSFSTGTRTGGVHLADGTKTFTITVKDVAGNAVSTTRTVNVDTVNPAVSAVVTGGTTDVPQDKVYLDVSGYKKITVTASDPDAAEGVSGTGLAGVYYQVVAENASVPAFTAANEGNWLPLALGSDGWTGNVDFTTAANKTEGVHKIYVAAKDNAKNRAVYETAVPVTVDAQKPVITVTGPADAKAAEITLLVRVTDTNPSAPVVSVRNTENETISTAAAGISILEGTATPSYKEWEVSIPFNREAYNSNGVYQITVSGTDSRGRTADAVTHTIRKDILAPAVNVIDAPDSGKTGTDALYGTSFIFRGTAKDTENGADCSGLAKILYAFSRADEPPASSAYTELVTTDGPWSFTRGINAGQASEAGTDNLYEGKWYLYVLAEDKAGNRTATPVCREFDIDMNDPVLSVTAPADITQTKYTSANSIVLSGTVVETNGIQSLTIKVGNETAIPLTVTSGAWSYTYYRTNDNKDKALSAKITVTDIAGKTAEKTVPFYFDTMGPSVTITQPVSGEITNTNTYALNGTVADIGIGVKASSGTYEIKKGSTTVASGALVISGASWSAGVDLDDNELENKEGSLDLKISIKDELNQVTEVTRTFFYDKNLPIITETGVGTSKITNSEFTFSGTASDTNALYNDGTGAISITVQKEDGTQLYPDGISVDVAANGNWSKKFTPGSGTNLLADGTYNFTITVKDVANRTKTTTSTVVVDTVMPSITREADSFLTESPANGWFKKEYLGLRAIVADDNTGSGLASVEYAVISNPASVPDASAWKAGSVSWNTMTKTTAAYTASAQMVSGKNYICIRATDKAGNIKYAAHEEAQVDLRAPAITGIFTDAGCTQALAGSTCLTNKKDLTLYLKTDDYAGSGVSALTVSINGNQLMAEAVSGATDTYLLSVAEDNLDAYLGAEGAHIVSASISDTAGNSTSVSQLFTIQYDTTAPAVAFNSPEAEASVNKKVSVSGTTTESQSLESVKLYIVKDGSDVELKTFSGNERFNWTYLLNTYDSVNSASTYVASSEDITLKVIAKDSAGNETSVTRAFTVDQARDCPEITINNIDFDENEEKAEPVMSATNPKWLIGSRTIYGSVTDDDGNVKKLEMGIVSESGTDWSDVQITNGSFATSLSDGRYTILFRVTDKNDTVFTTAAENVLARPVLKGSDDVASADNRLYVTVDTTNPNADVPEFSFNGTEWDSNLLSQNIFGGNAENNTLYVRQFVYDKNDIKKVEVSIGNGAFSEASRVLSNNQPVTKVISGNTYTAYQYQVMTAQIAAATSGTQTLNIRVTDNAGMSKETNATFTVDNTAPVVSVTNYADGDRVKGQFYIAGTSSDAPLYGGADTILYMVTGSETLTGNEDWTPIATDIVAQGAHEVKGENLSSWRVYFDGNTVSSDEYTHDRLLMKILVTIDGYKEYLEIATEGENTGKVVYSRNYTDANNEGHNKGDLYKDITTLYVHFRAEDAFGNVNSDTVRALEYDPQGDIPSVKITYPGAAAYRWRNATSGDEYFTADMLPEAGSHAFTEFVNVAGEKDPVEIQAINRTSKTITVDGVAYTYVGGESVQGGIVRVQGIAEDENAIAFVYIQIDPTYDPADGFQWSDATAGSEILPYGTTPESQLPADKTLGSKYNIVDIGDTGKKGIQAGSSGAWSISLNDSGEFNGTKASSDDETSNNYVAVRAIALDADGNISPSTDILILTIDADTPRIGTSEELYLYQYSDNTHGTGTITASQKYMDDMWLKGEWWLEGSVEDSNGIATLKIDGASAGSKATGNQTWGSGTNTTYGYKLKFKIGNSSSGDFGKEEHLIYAVDTDDKTVQKTIRISYDNKAPELAPTNSEHYDISPTVVQSNGFYTLKSAVTEPASPDGLISQSGFERVALYFIRPGADGTGKLYDTYFLKNTAGSPTANEISLSDLTLSEGLYWKSHTITRNANFLNKFTLTDADPNVHIGGMVKINGAMYIIKDISADGKTFEINGYPVIINNDSSDSTHYLKENASFAMAMIVDHALTETPAGVIGANGYYEHPDNDDGDCMVEVVKTQNITTTWEANINSRNIPDGAIQIHYVAFDKAGNYASAYVSGTVANNAPRLASVRYGIDKNGDGTVSDSELEEADNFGKNADGTYKTGTNGIRTSYVLGTKTTAADGTITCENPVLTVKGAVKVIPEIVGGNGALYYSWSVTKNKAKTPYYSIGHTALGLSGSDYSGKGMASEIKQAAIALDMKSLLTNIGTAEAPVEIEDGEKQLITFTIWDSTEGMIAGTDSQHAVLEMVADIKLRDTTPPVPVIKPFYWKNKTNNSIYKITDSNETTTLYGHIDLSADLPTGTDKPFAAGNTGVFDLDDKVSGAIVIEGSANDDTLLSGIYMRIFTGTNTDKFNFPGLTAVNAAALTQMKLPADSPLLGYYPVASYDKLTGWGGTDNADKTGKIVSGNYATKGWQFEIIGKDTFDADGHTTNWRLILNTEKLTGIVVSNLKVSVIATDRGKPTLNGTTVSYKPNNNTVAADKTTTAALTALNQFDVVPYILKLETAISNSAGEEFARSATGRYSVRNGEIVKVYGYNLDTSKDTNEVIKTTVSLGNSNLQTSSSGTDADGTYVAAIIGSASGSIKVKVSGIESLNNSNDNNAAGTPVDKENNAVTVSDANYATYAYNRTPNGITNNRLTDDVMIWVWSMDTFVDDVNITSPMMKMDSKSNWYMSYGKGIQQMYVNINGESSRSVDYSYNKFHNTNVAYDDKGRIWAVAMNTDRIRDDSSRYVLYAPLSNIMPAESGSTSTEYRASSDTKRHLELAYNQNTGEYNINRTKNAKLITSTIAGDTIIATSYYDANNTINPIKVRFGKYGREVKYSNKTFTYSSTIQTYAKSGRKYVKDKTVAGWLAPDNNNYNGLILKVGGTEYSLTQASYTNSSGGTSYYYTITNLPVTTNLSGITVYNTSFGLTGGLNGQIKDGVTASANDPTITMSESNDPTKTDSSAKGYHIVASNDTSINGGAYTALGIVPSAKGKNGYVGVIAWYDAKARKLAFSYNTDPESAYVAYDTTDTTDTKEQWMKHAFYIDSSMYTGWYVDMAVDAGGGIHIAYYDSGKGDLKYAYLDSFEDTVADVVTVDSYLSVGTNISMTVRQEGTGTDARYVPYIYYYNASSNQTVNSVRVAWQYNADLGNGAVSDKFTGNWEVMTVPTELIPVDATVCGGSPVSGTYGSKVVLGYMTDAKYEMAVLQK